MANGGDMAKFPAWNQIEKIAGQNMFYIKKTFGASLMYVQSKVELKTWFRGLFNAACF